MPSADIAIFGGGVAGLWLLDRCVQRGYDAILLESAALGRGQTVASQGIIHGGLKYTLDGLLNPSAAAIRDMPDLWRACLAGTAAGEPDLRGTRWRSPHCHLWRTDDLLSRVAMIGARAGLAIAPQKVERGQRPPVLADCPAVFLLEEPVLDPRSLVETLARPHAGRLLAYDAASLQVEQPATPARFSVAAGPVGPPQQFQARAVVLTAGAGNAELRRRFGLPAEAMQLRPLHMVMLRGELPELNGHCVDRAHTRVTVTTDRDRRGATVWQVGGQIAEDGLRMSPAELVRRAADELRACIPGLNLTGAEWSTYRVDRAEAAAGGKRPNAAHVQREGALVTAWPTKLALAPRLADAVLDSLKDIAPAADGPRAGDSRSEWPRPPVADAPWDEEAAWIDAN